MKNYFSGITPHEIILFICVIFIFMSCMSGCSRSDGLNGHYDKSSGLSAALLSISPSGKADEIKALINKGANINTKNEFGSTPLDLAIIANNYDAVKLFLELGQHPTGDHLAIASANGYLELVKLLLRFDVNPNASGSAGNTALMSATAHPEIFKTLIDHKANINAKDNYDRTVMMWAALHGSPEVVDLLCSLGVDLEQKDKGGNTALSEATKKDRSEIKIRLQKCLRERK
jgi:ankyrin repeat protein